MEGCHTTAEKLFRLPQASHAVAAYTPIVQSVLRSNQLSQKQTAAGQ